LAQTPARCRSDRRPQEARLRLYISSDIEGAAGIVDWQQVRGPGPEYELGRRLLAAEVNAAIDGAVAAGAEQVLVNDSHASRWR